MNQQKVWDTIAKPWNKFRKKQMPEVLTFIKKQKGKLLDLGCGSGRHFIKKSNLQIYGVDFSEQILKYAKNKKIAKEIIQAPSDKLPFKDNFFDSAICIALLHCLKKQTQLKTLKELHRVLKPKAQVLISVWSRNSKRLKNKPKESNIPWTVNGKKQKRYSYIYDKDELEKQIKKAKFKIIKSQEDKNITIIAEKPTPSL